MRAKSDGHNAEEIDIEIGRLIRTHPTNFLRALSARRDKLVRLDALLGNFGLEYVDEFAKQKLEAELRIKALKQARLKTSDPNLRNLANECIKILESHPVFKAN